MKVAIATDNNSNDVIMYLISLNLPNFKDMITKRTIMNLIKFNNVEAIFFLTRRARSSAKVSVSCLCGPHQCELSPGLHQLANNKFTSIVGQFFKQVTSNKDYFFYSFTGGPPRRCPGVGLSTIIYY